MYKTGFIYRENIKVSHYFLLLCYFYIIKCVTFILLNLNHLYDWPVKYGNNNIKYYYYYSGIIM